jgi:diguanylate cyclase (GGDEF)-like protein/PAS domain S-box-containing protein
MRVIAGDGHGEDRFESDGSLLRLVHAIETTQSEADVLRTAVEGLAVLFEAACAAITLSPGDGSLVVAASSHSFEGYAEAVGARRLPLSADALAADAVLTGSYVVDREPFAEEQRVLIDLYPGRAEVRAAAAVSIHSADGTVGVFLLMSDRETTFGSRRMEGLRIFAGITALEIHRRRELRALVAQRADARALLEVAKNLSRFTDEDSLLGEIVAHCRQASGATFAVAWTLSGNLFEPAAIDGDDGGFTSSVKLNADATLPLGQGPEGRAVRTGRIETVKDAETDRAYAPWLEPARRSHVRSILALPLSVGDGRPVVIALYAPDVDAFEERTVAHLEAYASHARLALETARAFAATALAARDKSLRSSAAHGVTRQLDLGEVARSIARAAGEAIGADFAVTYVGDRDTLAIAGAWNPPPNLAINTTLNIADQAMASYPPVQAARERRIVVFEDVTTDAQWLRQGWDQQALMHGFNSVVAAPLADGRQAGAVVLFFASRPKVGEAEAAALTQIGVDAAGAIDAARKFERARSARDFLNRVLEESTDAIVQIDLQGLVVGWNGGAERMFGLSRDDVIGVGFADMAIVPAESREIVREIFSRVARGEQVRALEIVCRGREGEAIDMLLSATPSRDEDGNIVGLVAFSKDITEQKKRYSQLLDQNRKLATIREITRAFGREVGIAAVAQKALDKLLETQRLDAGRIYVFESRESRLINVAQRGFAPEGCEPIDVRPSTTGTEGLLCSSVYYRETMVLNDVEGEVLEHPHLAERTVSDVTSVLTKPLAVGDQMIGAVQVIGFDGRRLSFDDQSLFHAVADDLASAMRSAQLLEEASRMAITDPLTGLYNYRFAHDFLKKRLSEARRRRRPFSVIMADVDGLQAINERYGRTVGDEVLNQFGRCLASCVRLSDVVARYGGDEFIVLLPETQLGDALMLAERMTHAFASHEWDKPVEDLELTASMGCASFPESGSNTQMLLKAADAALFQAKKFGKNAIFPRADTLPRFAG